MTPATGNGWTLYHGRWQDTLPPLLADLDPERVAVITDPPYSDRTHRGQRSCRPDGRARNAIDYGPISEPDVVEMYAAFGAAAWIVVFGDHMAARWYERAALNGGRYAFPPIPWCKPDAAPRMSGDGPPSSVEHVSVSRLRSRAVVDRLARQPSGYYVLGTAAYRNDQVVVGGKPLPLMRTLVREYTQPGDVVIDPYAGGGTTLLAAAIEGRHGIGCEVDRETYGAAVDRLRAGFTGRLF